MHRRNECGFSGKRARTHWITKPLKSTGHLPSIVNSHRRILGIRIAERAVRPLRLVFDAPFFDHNPRLFRGIENLSVQTIHLAVFR